MTFSVNADSLDNYELGEKIYERADGSYLSFATGKKEGGGNFFIRARKADNEASVTMFKNEKQAGQFMSKLKSYALPLLAVFEENGYNFSVYKNPHNAGKDKLLTSPDFNRSDQDQLKGLTSQAMTFYTKLNKLNLFPIEDFSMDNVILSSDDQSFKFIGFENVLLSSEESNGLTSQVTKIAEGAIGLKTNFLKAGDFVHYLFTGSSLITENGLKVLADRIRNEDVLTLVNDCVSKSSDELKNFNPFKSEFLAHSPEISFDTTHISVDSITVDWSEGLSFSIGELSFGLDLESFAVTIGSGDNELQLGAEGLVLSGNADFYPFGCGKNTVTLNTEGLKLEDWWNTTTVNQEGLKVSSTRNGNLTIDENGLDYSGNAGTLKIGDSFECTISDFKPSFGNPFKLQSSVISTMLSGEFLRLDLAHSLILDLFPKPSLQLLSNGTRITINDSNPVAIDVGGSTTFAFTGSSVEITLGFVTISIADGSIVIDNDLACITINKDGFEFETHGIPVDLTSIKDKLTCPTVKIPLPAIKLPAIPGLPPMPKPSADIGGCCNIF